MALSYKSRRRWSLVILLIGLPIYIVVSISLVNLAGRFFGRPVFLLEMAIYVILGIAWILPFKSVFLGVGQADPDAGADEPDKEKEEP